MLSREGRGDKRSKHLFRDISVEKESAEEGSPGKIIKTLGFNKKK